MVNSLIKYFHNNFVYLLLITIMLVAFVVRYTSPTEALDRLIVPDGVEYAKVAFSLVDEGTTNIYINNKAYPSRYPIGFPLLIAPFYLLFGKMLGVAVYTSLFFGLCSIYLAYLIVSKLNNKEAGLLAAFLVSINPLHKFLSMTVMSETAALSLLLVSIYLLLFKRESLLFSFVRGGVLAFSVLINVSAMLTVVIPMILYEFVYMVKDHNKRFKAFRNIVIGLSIGLTPFFIHNIIHFGGILNTGYEYWVSNWAKFANAFSLNYAFVKPAMEGTNSNLIHYGKYIFITTTPYLLGSIILFGLFVVRVVKYFMVKEKRQLGARGVFTEIVLLLAAVNYLVYSFYFFSSERFILFIIVLIILSSAREIYSFLELFFNNLKQITGSTQIGYVFLVLFVLFYVGNQKASFLNLYDKQYQSWKIDYFRLIDEFAPDDACVISAIDGVQFNHFLQRGNKRLYIPISSSKMEYVNKTITHKGNKSKIPTIKTTNKGAIISLLKRNKAIYVDDYWCRNYLTELKYLVENFDFIKVAKIGKANIYRIALKS